MNCGISSSSRSKWIMITKEKPPRENLGGGKEQIVRASVFHGVPTSPVLDGGRDFEPHLSAEHSGNEASHRVSLPAGGLHEIGSGGAGGALQQVEDRFAPRAGTLPVLGQLGRLRANVGFLRWSGLLGRLTLARCNVSRLCANTRAFGRGRFGGQGGGLSVRGLFWILVHRVFSLSGDYRDHMDHSDARRLQAKSHANRHRPTIAFDFGHRIAKGGAGW
jgi:hypothetical protein